MASTYYTGQYLHGQPVGEWIFYEPGGKETEARAYDAQGNEIEVGSLVDR